MSRFWSALIILGSLGALIADRAGKALATQFPPPREFLVAGGDWLRLGLVYNDGIAFGLPLPLSVTLVIHTLLFLGLIGAMVSWWRRDQIAAALVAMVGLGALSNLIDRYRLGSVIDYLTIPNWGSCNIADILIVAGIAALIIRHLWRSSPSP